MNERSPNSTPHTSPTINIAHTPKITTTTTPMQNVTNSVARKSTTIGRTLELPLEASISIPLCKPRFGPCPVLKPPKKAPPGEEDGKLPKNCGRNMAMLRATGPAEKECAIFSAGLFPLVDEGMNRVDHAPPPPPPRKPRRNPRQLRGRAQEARLRGKRARGARRGDGRLQDAAPRSRRDRHRPGRGARRRLHAVPRAARTGSQPAYPLSHRDRKSTRLNSSH